jgi:anaerobic selenocysteine-containing dehydrogenase
MHPADLARIGVRPGDVVRIDSDHDFIYGVAEATTDVRPGVVSMAHARGGEPELDAHVRTIGSSTARLVSVERDFEPISGIPRQSAIPVNVRALRSEELARIAP